MSHFGTRAALTAMRIAHFLPSLALLVLGLPLVGLGCNAKVANVLDSDDAATNPGTDGGPVADGGPVTDGGTTPVDGATEGGPTVPGSPVCYNDPGCNADPAASALWGKCFGGICICAPGYHVQASGKCGKALPPDCTTQAGKCTQQPATCPAGALESTLETNMSCGDLIAAVCCFTADTCGGPSQEVAGAGRTPIEMICCAPNDASSPPICVNGWQTCRPGETAVEKRFGCG